LELELRTNWVSFFGEYDDGIRRIISRKPSSSLHANRDQITIAIAPRLLTIKQAAAYCSCSIWAIREVILSNELPAYKIGRRFLIDRSDLDRFIDARLRERAS
jgi:excisionase family DNA binding protein